MKIPWEVLACIFRVIRNTKTDTFDVEDLIKVAEDMELTEAVEWLLNENNQNFINTGGALPVVKVGLSLVLSLEEVDPDAIECL